VKKKCLEISVVMAVYNGAKYLREAIDSILAQSFVDFEFIIVDDGSTDETPQILNSYDDSRILIFWQTNQGPAAAANKGIKESSVNYIARLDADDVAASDRLEMQYEFMQQNPDCVIVGGFLEIITADGIPIYIQEVPTGSEEIKRSIQNKVCPFLHSSVMFRKSSAIRCGLYNEDLRSGVDPDFYKRLYYEGQMANLPTCLGQYRIAPGAITNQTRKNQRKRAQILLQAETEHLTTKNKDFLKKIVNHKNSRHDTSLYALRVGNAYLQHTNNIKSARNYLWQAIKFWKFNWPAWYNLLLTYLSPSARQKINNFRGLKS
jgi:glycosyltransferase involved in cell wall biosynthesis